MAIVVGVLVLIANLVVVLAFEADSDPTTQGAPSVVEEVVPAPGSLVRQQEDVAADLRDDRFGVLVVDGVEIPEDQLLRVEPLGQVRFRPGPGKEVERWSAGTHRAVVLHWPRGEERPARPASYGWTFRVGG